MSTNYFIRQKATNGEYIFNNVSIGFRSCGWKFLWNTNIYKDNYGQIRQLYDLSMQGIIDFIMRDDIEVYSENSNNIDKEDFLSMAFNWNKLNTYDYLHNPFPPCIMPHADKERINMISSLGYKFYIEDEYQNDFILDEILFSIDDMTK